MFVSSNPHETEIKFPFELLDLARKENEKLMMFDRRVIWLRGISKPLIFDVFEPYVIDKSYKVERVYLQGFRVCGVDKEGWKVRSFKLVTTHDESLQVEYELGEF